jgi:hypothetical protein
MEVATMDKKDLPDWLFKPTFEEIMKCFEERRQAQKKLDSFDALVKLASTEIMERIEMEEKFENTTCENLQTRQKRRT